jgi:hypothetical protein
MYGLRHQIVFLCAATIYTVKKMCLYTHLCKDYMNYLCYQMILQVKLFHKSKAVQSIERILITW